MKRLALALALAFACSCEGRPRVVVVDQGDDPAEETYGSGTLFEFDLSRGAPEGLSDGSLFPRPVSRTYPALVQRLRQSGAGTRADGFLVRLGTQRFNWAQSEELGRLLNELRETGRPVVCHAHALGNSTLLLALRGCDRIWLSPAGEVESVGIAAQNLYLKGLLERLDVRADFLHVGKYKSAAESLTHEEPTPAARESLLGVLASLRQSWLVGLKQARPDSESVLSAESGPWNAQEAKERGLIDEIGYASDAREDAKKSSKAGEIESGFGRTTRDPVEELAALIRALAATGDDAGQRPRVAVVPAQGAITMEAGGPLASGGITWRAFERTLRRLKRDESVKAVVLRIDSPGGSALASDLLWHELMALRAKKPLVVSVGGMAASGGYYLACAAHQVLAEQTSIVGSIGVVGGKIVIDEALRGVGVNAVTLSPSSEPGAETRATYLSPFSPWDDATRQRLAAQMRHIYDLFVRRVAEGRKLEAGHVESVAEGRIWSGRQGLEHKLIDRMGGLRAAIGVAKELASLPEDAPVFVEGAAETLMELLMLGGESDAASIRAAVNRQRSALTLVDRLAPSLRPFAATLQPLLDGEKVLAAAPMALSVR